MSEKEIEVYGKIFDELKEYMCQQGQTISTSKKVFLMSLGHKSNCVDMSMWNDLNDSDYIDVSYLELLRRFPLGSDKEYWLHEPENRKKLIQTILESGEFLNLHTSVINNPYPIDERRLQRRQKLYGGSYEQLSQTWYYRLYMKFPVKVRLIFKKLAGI